ncbi:MAG: MBL fold metallo-hydrolase [Planctomycetes bacterium]|nr:MBL fold metallo-hydrolase [Planctomycetota bacterium]
MSYPTGQPLIDDINNTQLNKGELAFWWLGQHSFIVKIAGKVLYIDPFLTEMDARRIAPLLTPNQVTHADFILGTHDHADHIDRPVWPALAAASPQATFIVPDLLRESLAADLNMPLDRFLGLDDGKSIERDGIRISAVAAAHEFLDRDDASGRYPYLGYFIEAEGRCVYHAGDTCLYEGLIAKLRGRKIDVAFLPINGRDAKRLKAGIIGNMTYQEAVDLAGVIEPGLTVPAHYDMFAENLGEPRAFRLYMNTKYPHLKLHVCDYGRCVRL